MRVVSKVFVDAHYFIARINPRDDWNQASLEARNRLKRGVLLVTTHEAFIEVLAAFSSYRFLRNRAVQMIQAMKHDSRMKIVPPSVELFEKGLERYRLRPDKDYSLVDCISMVVMEEEGIAEILTNDHHFEQEGFVVLIR